MNLRRLFPLGLIIYANVLHAQGWKEVNPPPNIFTDDIFSIATDFQGNIYAAGKFKDAANENIVAKWDGQHWAELGRVNNTLKSDYIIYCVTTDQSGNVYAAGGFRNSTGNIEIPKWDGTAWSNVGEAGKGLDANGFVYAITIDQRGDLFVAGDFTDTSGNRYVAEWDGSNWLELGDGADALLANGSISALTTDRKGNVYAAGDFTDAAGKYYVAKWNGTNWIELGDRTPLEADGDINSLKTDTAGNVYAGGDFTDSTGKYYIARWDGRNWSEVGSGTNRLTANAPFNTIEISPGGTIYAAGFGTDVNGSTDVIKWDNNIRSEVFPAGHSSRDAVRTLCLDKAGNLYAGGDFKNAAGHIYVAKWNGSTLGQVGFLGEDLQVIDGISNIAVGSNGEVYAYGNFFSAPAGDYFLAHWKGKTWSRLPSPLNSINGYYRPLMATDLSGNLYVAGNFTDSAGKYYIAKWDGHSWSELGSRDHPIKIYAPISLLTCDKKGNVYAGGAFGTSNGFSYGIIKWDGSRTFFYGYSKGTPCSLVVDTAGNIYAGNSSRDENGKYYVEKINENGISRLGSGSTALNSGSEIRVLAIDGEGNLLASGLNNEGFSEYNQFVAKWDGTSWSRAGSANGRYAEGYVSAMVSDDSGNVYAASTNSSGGYYSVAKWNGKTWSELGNPRYFNSNIGSLAIDTLGNIYAAGLFSDWRYQFVAEYVQGQASLKSPQVSSVASQYCHAEGLQSVKIINFPDTPVVSVSGKLDDTRLTLKTDSSFEFNPSALSVGAHKIKISYSSHGDTTFFSKKFDVIEAATPVVKIISNTGIGAHNAPVTLTAENIEGGGLNPEFVFSVDRNFTTVLQAESSDSTLVLDPDELVPGENPVYVSMRTSDFCYTHQTGTDSIDIRRSTAVSAITDPDYPDQKIFLYPNPFRGALTIQGLQVSKTYIVSGINSLGETIFQKTSGNSTEVTIKGIAQPGIYWISVYDKTRNRLLGSLSAVKQ